ncbi:MAG: hypothetical protein WC082_08000, partial [Victivallales bacterium]
MIISVWGEINGVGKIPVLNVGGKYYFTPPQTLTGRYICQFWAEDDFGNIANSSALLTIFKGMIKCIEVLSPEWHVMMLGNSTTLTPLEDDWVVKMLPI